MSTRHTRSSQRSSVVAYLLCVAQEEAFPSPQAAVEVLTAAFGAGDYLECIKDLTGHGIDPKSNIDSLYRVSPDRSRRRIRALRDTCGLRGRLPTSHTIPFRHKTVGQRPFASDGDSDIWKILSEEGDEQVFAVKSFRIYRAEDIERMTKVRNDGTTARRPVC